MPVSRPVQRFGSALLILLMLIGATLAPVGATPAAATPQKQTVFFSSFNALPRGPLAPGTAIPVELGSVYPDTATVEILANPAGGGNALAVGGGAGAAQLRFKAYPDGLPPPNGNDPNPTNGNDKYDLVVSGGFTASISDTIGAEFGLDANGTFFELFSFGAAGQLTRAGTPISVTYGVSSTVLLEARVHLSRQTSDIRITSRFGSTILTNIPVPAGIGRESLNALRFAATGGTGVYTIDNATVRIERDKGTPAVILIPEPEIDFAYENGVCFFFVFLAFQNTGGDASYVFLTLDLDVFLELADMSWLEGAGYVVQIKGSKVEIGIGTNNQLPSGGAIKLKLKFKVKGDGVKIKLKLTFEYNDSTGLVVQEPIEIDQPVPAEGDDDERGDETGPVTVTVPLPRLTIARIDIRFKARWERGGGMRIYGLPLTEPIVLASGVTVQYFERARFEHHPAYAGTEYEILLGLLSVELGYAQPPVSGSGQWYVAQTGHTVAPAFRQFWQERGLMALGYPIGEAFTDANGRTVQYFERVRLEYHPEHAGTEFVVLLGLLGEEQLRATGGTVQ